MKLTSRQIELSKPKDKTYSLTDGGGLSLLVNPDNSKSWLFRYTRPNGTRNSISLGTYHKEINGLASARQQRDQLRKQLLDGVDPSQARKENRQAIIAAEVAVVKESFEAIAREWHTFKRPKWSKDYAKDVMEAFEKDIFPYVVGRHIASIKPKDWLEVFRKIVVADWGVKQMKTRWGTCNIRDRRIWLALELAQKPSHCLEYVVVHEMTHLLERHHNDRFKAYMTKFLPNWQSIKNELNQLPLITPFMEE